MIPVNQSVYVSDNPCRRGHETPLRYFSNNGCVACNNMRGRGEALPQKVKSPRDIAKESGDRFFDIGRDCPKGHGTLRLTSNKQCPKCQAVVAKGRGEDYKRRNREAKRAKYHADVEHREVIIARRADYYARVSGTEEFKEKESIRSAAKREANPCAERARMALHRGRKRNATPSWLTISQKRDIETFYREAARLEEITSVPHEVDHIVPLSHDKVCGLHVPWNLQILTAEENQSKSNALPDEKDRICLDQARRTPRYASASWKRTRLTMRS